MRTMHAALAEVARHMGLAHILPDADGFAELVVDETLSIFLRSVDEEAIELSARLPEFDGRLSVPVMDALLRWNGRFNGLRFAVESDRNGVVLGRRIDIDTEAADTLPRAVEAFVLAVADWRRHGAEALLHSVIRHEDTGFASQMSGLRL